MFGVDGLTRKTGARSLPKAAYVMGLSLPPVFVNLIFGIIAARAAGMQAIGFTGGGHISDDHGAYLHATGAAATYMQARQT